MKRIDKHANLQVEKHFFCPPGPGHNILFRRTESPLPLPDPFSVSAFLMDRHPRDPPASWAQKKKKKKKYKRARKRDRDIRLS